MSNRKANVNVKGVWLLLMILVNCGNLLAQEYKIQVRDRLSVTFWQEPDLNTEVVVSQNGTIDLPVVGRTLVVGLSAPEISDKIIEEISRYRINITQVSVRISQYEGNKIYVTGQVGAPGTYSFEVIPNLWRILQEAGGLLETADLQQITVVRGSETGGNIITVDLTEYFEKGELSRLPALHGGDTIHVPASALAAGTGGPGGTATSSPFTARNEIYVFGAVVTPGRYALEKDIDLLDAIVLAGGPTDNAKLSEVKIVSEVDQTEGIIRVDLNRFLSHAYPGPPRLSPGDTIYIPRKANPVTFLLSRVLLPIVTSASVFLVVNAVR